MPRATHPLTASRTDSRPARCPISRGTPRARAQRPFPSMMIAMCRGRLPRALSCSGVSVRVDNGPPSPIDVGSDLHDFRGLLLEQLVEQGDVSVGELLHVAGEALGFIFGQSA